MDARELRAALKQRAAVPVRLAHARNPTELLVFDTRARLGLDVNRIRLSPRAPVVANGRRIG
jgi:hypothetical protein